MLCQLDITATEHWRQDSWRSTVSPLYYVPESGVELKSGVTKSLASAAHAFFGVCMLSVGMASEPSILRRRPQQLLWQHLGPGLFRPPLWPCPVIPHHGPPALRYTSCTGCVGLRPHPAV